MKISKFVFFMAVTAVGLISCRKDEGPKSVAGTWEGNWGSGYDPPSFFEKWELKNGGDLKAFFPDGSVYALGSWDQDGEEIEVHYTTVYESYHYTFTGTFDEDDDEITGDWEDSDEPVYRGTFEMQRQ
jgi:hypothetical protein